MLLVAMLLFCTFHFPQIVCTATKQRTLLQTLFVADYQFCEAFRLQHVTLEVLSCHLLDKYEYKNRTYYYHLVAYLHCYSYANNRSDHNRLYAI